MRRYHEKKGNPGQRVPFREHLVQTEKALLVIAADFSPLKKKRPTKELNQVDERKQLSISSSFRKV